MDKSFQVNHATGPWYFISLLSGSLRILLERVVVRVYDRRDALPSAWARHALHLQRTRLSK